MPFRPLFLLNLSRNQVFLLEIMYPNTSLLFDPNRSTHDECIFPIINPQCIVQNVFCALHACHSSFVHVFIRGDTKTSTKYDFFSFSPPHEIRAFFQGYFVSKYPLSLTTTVELVCQTFMPFVLPPPTLLYYNFCQGPSTAPVCSFTKRIPFLLPCRDLGKKLRYARSTSENFLNG